MQTIKERLMDINYSIKIEETKCIYKIIQALKEYYEITGLLIEDIEITNFIHKSQNKRDLINIDISLKKENLI